MRALAFPGFTYLIVRRTIPELKKSHLKPNFVPREMRIFGGTFHKTDNIAHYPNGSIGFYSHCETEDDMMKLLGSEYDAIYFDEISTFTWSMITRITSCLRVREGSGLLAIVRGGTNPIGVGASDVKRYFITKDVNLEDDPEYDPKDFEAIKTTLDDNPHIDRDQYIKTLQRLPEHLRRAWLDGEWIVEGAYFHDFRPMKGGVPWHVADTYPRIKESSLADWDSHKWIQIYRAFDWGFAPDPAVCLWVASLPVGRSFVFKERTWRSTTARQVAKDIAEDSYGMHIVETYCDPTIFYGSEATEFTSIGDIMAMNGVSMTPGKNDRAAIGYAIHEQLNTVLSDGLPQLQIYGFGCPQLCRTIPEMQTHKTHPERIADGNDHYVISLGYYCQGRVGVSKEYVKPVIPRWMQMQNKSTQYRLGSESMRTKH
jgi:hypothetical protein